MKIVLAVGCCLLVAGGAAAAQRPSVELMATKPLVVKGTNFKAGERVAVQVLGSVRAGRSVIAGPRGAFVVRFRLRLEPCERLVVHAFGARGSRARLLPHAERGCLPTR